MEVNNFLCQRRTDTFTSGLAAQSLTQAENFLPESLIDANPIVGHEAGHFGILETPSTNILYEAIPVVVIVSGLQRKHTRQHMEPPSVQLQ
tara:strand:+ start:808 stop:1080 length:273 start_codon:yes stop_codon:yes gene_type:complete